MIITSIVLVLILPVYFADGTPPQILGPSVRTVDAGNEFSLTCEGDGELQWNVTEKSGFTITHSGSNPQASTITLSSPSYMNTGYFTCSGKDDPPSSVYVYFWDPEHLLAVDVSQSVINAYQNDNITIPCRPTSPNVKVTLQDGSGDVVDALFDPTIGFQLLSVTVSDSSFITCRAENGDDFQEEYLHLHVEPSRGVPVKPMIDPNSTRNVQVDGEAMLICTVEVDSGLFFNWNWTWSHNVSNYKIWENKTLFDHGNEKKLRYEKTLLIYNASKSDDGEFTCTLQNHDDEEHYSVRHALHVRFLNESFINLTVETTRISVNASHGVVRWAGELVSHPAAKLSCITPGRTEIKYKLNQTGTRFTLEIYNVTVEHSGNYTIVAANDLGDEERVVVSLEVWGEPQVNIKKKKTTLYRYGEVTNVSCRVIANPPPTIDWFYRKCDSLDEYGSCDSPEIPLSRQSGTMSELQLEHVLFESILQWEMNSPGELICRAVNKNGSQNDSAPLRVTDAPNGFSVSLSPEEIVVDDTVELTCTVDLYFHANSLEWVFGSESLDPVTNDTDVYVTYEDGYFSRTANITFQNISKARSGDYVCRAKRRNSEESGEEGELIDISENLKVTVLDPMPPVLTETNLNDSEVELRSWQTVNWICRAEGIPRPEIVWLKDGWPLTPNNNTPVKFGENNETLSLMSLTKTDEGQYECIAKSRIGFVGRYVHLRLKEPAPIGLIITVIIVAILLLLLSIYLGIRIYREKQRRKELSLAGLLNFRQGGVSSINPDLTLDEQTDLLPYDVQWEFPRNKLHLGKQLGAGAFGVVMKAEAEGIVPNEARTAVAVKMVKRHSEPALVRALAGELKIMAHLGRHANVVNLLGACTSQLAKRELLVIVEFCKFGNVHNYLLTHRSRFLDQIDPLTGEINISQGRIVGYERNRIHYARLDFPRSVESAQFSGASHDTESTLVSAHSPGEESSLIPAPVAGDYVFSEGEPLSTSVLVAWGFQIARGMEYLSSRRVLHGDLAARNILLAEGNVVKICDFGLARSIYGNEYRKAGSSLLPVKWLAIESIRDRVFSTQSDVWSFGVVLWELFSLARTPYAGAESFESILEKLLDGYRLEKPDYATQRLYDIMKECWNIEPGKRPSFTDLSCKFGILMEDSVREHYIQLNDQYTSMGNFGTEDYLAMVRPPTYDGSAPRYVNLPIDSPGYLDMSSDGEGHEMKPMLGRLPSDAENNDYLMPRQTPFSASAISNPTYHIQLPTNDTTAHANNNAKTGDYGKLIKPERSSSKCNEVSEEQGEKDLSNFQRNPVKDQISFFESFKKREGQRRGKELPK